MGERRGGEKDDNAIDEKNDGGFFLFSPIVCCFYFCLSNWPCACVVISVGNIFTRYKCF